MFAGGVVRWLIEASRAGRAAVDRGGRVRPGVLFASG